MAQPKALLSFLIVFLSVCSFANYTARPLQFTAKFYEEKGIFIGSFGNNYQYIKQHFMISLKYKWVYYFGFGTHLPQITNVRNVEVYNFKMTYDDFFSLK